MSKTFFAARRSESRQAGRKQRPDRESGGRAGEKPNHVPGIEFERDLGARLRAGNQGQSDEEGEPSGAADATQGDEPVYDEAHDDEDVEPRAPAAERQVDTEDPAPLGQVVANREGMDEVPQPECCMCSTGLHMRAELYLDMD